MSFAQRAGVDPERRRPRGPWRPGHLDEVVEEVAGGAASFDASGPPTSTPDLYVVVDELDELGCRLTVDAWPAVDADGRLVFGDDARLVTVPPARLHATLTEARARAGEPVPDRPLRIGDVLAVWRGPVTDQLLDLAPDDLTPDDLAPDDRDPAVGPVELLDVTADAREATNAAAQAAAGDVLTSADLAAYGIDVRDPADGPDPEPGS